jgi:hypothetical protein
MEKEYTAVVKQDGKWWIGWIEEIPGINLKEKKKEVQNGNKKKH